MTAAEWTTIDQAQAERLFSDNAVLLGKRDVIPAHIAHEILPEEAVTYVRDAAFAGEYWNAIGFGSLIPGSVEYLTRAGFFAAVSCANALCLWPEQFDTFDAPKTTRTKKEETAC